jgi:hypothetical protein
MNPKFPPREQRERLALIQARNRLRREAAAKPPKVTVASVLSSWNRKPK